MSLALLKERIFDASRSLYLISSRLRSKQTLLTYFSNMLIFCVNIIPPFILLFIIIPLAICLRSYLRESSSSIFDRCINQLFPLRSVYCIISITKKCFRIRWWTWCEIWVLRRLLLVEEQSSKESLSELILTVRGCNRWIDLIGSIIIAVINDVVQLMIAVVFLILLEDFLIKFYIFWITSLVFQESF